jgi:hypothetical protein
MVKKEVRYGPLLIESKEILKLKKKLFLFSERMMKIDMIQVVLKGGIRWVSRDLRFLWFVKGIGCCLMVVKKK